MNTHEFASRSLPVDEGVPNWLEIDYEVICPTCAYNLRFLMRPVCPECGTHFCWEEVLARAVRERCSFIGDLLGLFCSSFAPQSLTTDFGNCKRNFSLLTCLFVTSLIIPLVAYHILAWSVGWLSLKGVEDRLVNPETSYTSYMIVNALADGARVFLDVQIFQLGLIAIPVTIIATTTILIIASPLGQSGEQWKISRVLSLVLLAMTPSALWFGCLLYSRFVIVAISGAFGFGLSKWATMTLPFVISGIYCKYLVEGIRRELTCRRPILLAILASTGAIATAGIIWIVIELTIDYG